MRKKALLALGLMAVILILTAGSCSDQASLRTTTEREMVTLDLVNDMAGDKATNTFTWADEDFDFVTKYSTDYDVESWKITDSKSLKMEASIIARDPSIRVYVAKVHIDIGLLAGFERSEDMDNSSWQKYQDRAAQLNGITQDSMDHHFQSDVQPGFSLNSGHSYENVFAIEGFSKDIIEGWGYYTAWYGYTTMEQSRLTEDNLIKHGVYGNKVQIVYDLLIKDPNDEDYHIRSVEEELFIPINYA